MDNQQIALTLVPEDVSTFSSSHVITLWGVDSFGGLAVQDANTRVLILRSSETEAVSRPSVLAAMFQLDAQQPCQLALVEFDTSMYSVMWFTDVAPHLKTDVCCTSALKVWYDQLGSHQGAPSGPFDSIGAMDPLRLWPL